MNNLADRLKEMVMKAWKDGFLLAMLAIFVPQKANAVQEWIDITSQYITNYTFDGNTNQGWEFSWRNGTCNNRVDAMEFWNSTFDIHQNLVMAMAYMNKYQSDDYRREELIRIIEHSVEKLTLAELEALYYDMSTKSYIND